MFIRLSILPVLLRLKLLHLDACTNITAQSIQRTSKGQQITSGQKLQLYCSIDPLIVVGLSIVLKNTNYLAVACSRKPLLYTNEDIC